MKRKNIIPADEARQLNAAGDRPIDRLDSRTLERHLENIYIFKLGLRNSFGIDFRNHMIAGSTADSPQVLLNYLSEVTSAIRPRVKDLPKLRQNVYVKLEDEAVKSFWEIYYRFQPLIHFYAKRTGIEVDELGNVLGRAILLYEKHKGAKFYTYLEKTLRESVKNLRGRVLADQYYLPLSAGRLLPQLIWRLDQETLKLQRRLTPQESDDLVINCLREHAASFSESTMQLVAHVARTKTRTVSIDRKTNGGGTASCESLHELIRSRESTNPIDDQDEFECALRGVHAAFERAGFSPREQAILLERLNLSYNEELHTIVENEMSLGALRNRKQKLLVRFVAALHADKARRFGRFLHSEPQASRMILLRALSEFAESRSLSMEQLIQNVLNQMSLTSDPYKLSIAERGRLEQYLACQKQQKDELSGQATIDGHLFNKLKAALLRQDSLGFPCLSER